MNRYRILVVLLASSCTGVPGEDAALTCDAAEVSPWRSISLPDVGTSVPWHQIALAPPGRCDATPQAKLTWIDVDGDSERDLVWELNCGVDAQEASVTVFRLGPEGFDEGERWPIPQPPVGAWTEGVRWTWDACDPEGREDRGFMYDQDLDGDGWVDFVFFEACGEEGIGRDHFVVHQGGPGGWGDAETWALPASLEIDFWQDDPFLGKGEAQVATARLGDHDGLPGLDLTVRWNPPDPSMGEFGDYVWPLTEQGWTGTAQPWTVPISAEGLGVRPEPYGSSGECADGSWNDAVMFDTVGDPRADLIQFRGCDVDEPGTSYWRVWERTDDGLAEEPRHLTLPQLDPPDSFEGGTTTDLVRGPADCTRGAGQARAFLTDLLALGRPQIIHTESCVDEAIGREVWHVYPMDEDGFRETPLVLDMPALLAETRSQDAADAPWADLVRPIYLPSEDERYPGCGARSGEVLTMWRFGALGSAIVTTKDCDDADVGDTTWKVSTLTCTEPRILRD